MLDHEIYAMLLLMGGAGPPVEYRAVATSAAGVTTVSKPSGVTVGDIVLVWGHGMSGATPTLTTASGGTWSLIDNNNSVTLAGRLCLWFKVLNATDVANAWNLSDSADDGAIALRYTGNGVTTAAVVSSQITGSNLNFNVTAAGVTKSAGHYGMIGLAISTTPSTTIGAPSGFTERSQVALNSTLKIQATDNLHAYANGAAATWTDFNTPAAGSETGRGMLVEFTGA